MELIVFGYGFLALFVGSAAVVIGGLYIAVPTMRVDIKRELMR